MRYVVLGSPRQWSIRPLAEADDSRNRGMQRILVVNVPARLDTFETLRAVRDEMIDRVTWR